MDSESSMSFQKIVLIVAIIALILMLSVIGYMMYYSSQNQPFPPIEGTQRCPDYWDLSGANCTNAALSGMFSNIGSFITDVSCSLYSINHDLSCATITHLETASGASGCVDENWVRGNVTNGLSQDNCYLLGSFGATANFTKLGNRANNVSMNTVLTYKTQTLEKDVDWAKKYGITWDGYN